MKPYLGNFLLAQTEMSKSRPSMKLLVKSSAQVSLNIVITRGWISSVA